MADKNSNLYLLHFQLIPALYHKDKDAFMIAFGLAPDEFLANIYTEVYQQIKPKRFWQRKKVYPKEEFKAYKKLYPDGIMVSYVTLPEMEDGSHVYCTAYALVMASEETSFYTIEKSVFGTTCIGTVDENGNHINLGHAGNSPEENMEILHGFEVTDEESAVEVMKTVNPDGSYVDVISDRKTNRIEIQHCDAQGDNVERVYGRIVHFDPISDEDLDEHLASLDSRFK